MPGRVGLPAPSLPPSPPLATSWLPERDDCSSDLRLTLCRVKQLSGGIPGLSAVCGGFGTQLFPWIVSGYTSSFFARFMATSSPA